MTEREDRRGRGFAAFEHGFVKANVPEFEWVVHEAPSRRNPLGVDLSEARVGLVCTAGAYVKPQPPFNKFPESMVGDTSFRVIEGIPEKLRFSHGGINTKLAYADPGVAVPIKMLHDLATHGVIGEAGPWTYSFLGYMPLPDLLCRETGPQAARRLVEDEVDLVLLVPVCPICVQSVGLLQRVFDEHGLSTVSLSLSREITELSKPSLACFVEHPFGLPMGDVDDKITQRAVLEGALRAATEPHPDGTLLDLGIVWTKDDLRERQLRDRSVI